MSGNYERDRADMAKLALMRVNPERLWFGAKPKQAPAGTLVSGITGRTVTYPVHVLSVENFAHGLLGPVD